MRIDANRNLYAVTPGRLLARLRIQLILGLLATVVLPIAIYNLAGPPNSWGSSSTINTSIGASAAFLMATYLFRRAVTFPGVGILSHAMPAATAAYGLILAVFFGLRLDYSRLSFASSFILALLFFFLVSTYLRRRRGQRFYVVPSDSTVLISSISGVEWVFLKEPSLPPDPAPVVIADLRAEMGPEWERMIAETAISGHPVYHIKQVHESLTGRVEIEHLSENSFGSLIPNLSYRKVKRLADLTAALIALPIFLIPAIIVSIAIRMDSPGPVFFQQERLGYRGKTFRVLKFRTMFHGQARDRDAAITKDGDARITKVGRFLRRTRIDELPQIWNILRGEMSWIGPRPEALPLSQWYMKELPFYTYRHIVRPGITGWAQVNQGHVAGLEEVLEKLHYDFYYIKHFSAWLDILIIARTVAIIYSGFGAK